jgi:hypothetical protein
VSIVAAAAAAARTVWRRTPLLLNELFREHTFPSAALLFSTVALVLFFLKLKRQCQVSILLLVRWRHQGVI